MLILFNFRSVVSPFPLQNTILKMNKGSNCLRFLILSIFHFVFFQIDFCVGVTVYSFLNNLNIYLFTYN